MRKKKLKAMKASNAVEGSNFHSTVCKKQLTYGNFAIRESQFQKELELLRSGVDLLEESRRHG